MAYGQGTERVKARRPKTPFSEAENPFNDNSWYKNCLKQQEGKVELGSTQTKQLTRVQAQ